MGNSLNCQYIYPNTFLSIVQYRHTYYITVYQYENETKKNTEQQQILGKFAIEYGTFLILSTNGNWLRLNELEDSNNVSKLSILEIISLYYDCFEMIKWQKHW